MLPAAPATRDSRGSLLLRVAAYGASRGASEALLAIRGVLLAILLGPAGLGTWALLRLGMRCSALGAISIYRGMERELLQPDDGSSQCQSRTAGRAALGFVLVVSGAMSAMAVAASFLIAEPDHRLLLRGFAAASLAEAMYGYALVCTRVRANIRLYSLLEAGTALFHVVFAVGLAWAWGLAGAFAGLTIANLMGVVVAARWVELRPVLRVEPVRRLLKIGLPVALTMSTGILLATADRWVLAVWGGPTMLGYYAFAGSLAMAAGAFAVVIRTAVFPQLYSESFTDGADAALQRHLERAVLPFARLLPPLLGALSLALGPVVALAMPTYIPAVPPARIFLLAGIAIGLVSLASIGAVAAGQQHRLPRYAVGALAITVALSILVLIGGLGLGSVAGAALVGHLVFAAAVLRLNAKESGMASPNRFVLMTLMPLVWCAAAVTVAGALFPGLDAASSALAVGVYLLLLLPLLLAWRGEIQPFRFGVVSTSGN
jgi:O-antigen/teichoic acid export membrane protein